MDNMMILNDGALAVQTVTPDLYTRYLNYIDVMSKSVQTYEKALKQLFVWFDGHGITSPCREDIVAWRDELKATGHKPSTVQLYVTSARRFFQWTSDEGLYPNICEHVKGAKIDREHKKDALSASQAKEVLAGIDRSAITGLRDYAMISLMLTDGLRTIELNRADIGDLRNVAGSTVLFVQGKGHEEKAEYVAVSAPVEDAIRSYLRARGETDPKAPLFVSHDFATAGNRLTTGSISRCAKNALRRAGYDSERLTAHSLRHTAVTLALLSGTSLEEVQQFARHADINTTMIYNHAIENAKAKSAGTAAVTDCLF